MCICLGMSNIEEKFQNSRENFSNLPSLLKHDLKNKIFINFLLSPWANAIDLALGKSEYT